MSHIHLKIQTILGQLEVDLWNWDSFQRDYVATRCRLTLLTPVHASAWQTTAIALRKISWLTDNRATGRNHRDQRGAMASFVCSRWTTLRLQRGKEWRTPSASPLADTARSTACVKRSRANRQEAAVLGRFGCVCCPEDLALAPQVPAKPVRSEEDAILDLAFRQAQAPRLLGSALCKLICKPHF